MLKSSLQTYTLLDLIFSSKYFNNVIPQFQFSMLKLKSEEINKEDLKQLKLEEYGADTKKNILTKIISVILLFLKKNKKMEKLIINL